MLLFHSYHFWREGKPVYVVEPELARALPRMTLAATRRRSGRRGPRATSSSRNLYWARVDGHRAEPVDGLFWTMKGADGRSRRSRGAVDCAPRLGLRPGRPGSA